MEKAVAATVGSRPITTFVHTDSNSFREVVQRLTGPTDEDAGRSSQGNNNIKAPSTAKRPTASLHERRHCARQRLEIAKPNVLRFGPGIDDNGSLISPSRSSGLRSPGVHAGVAAASTTPTSNFSKLSITERRSKGSVVVDTEVEERAVKERRFYLHQSPRTRPEDPQPQPQPQLLNLFPLTSPSN